MAALTHPNCSQCAFCYLADLTICWFVYLICLCMCPSQIGDIALPLPAGWSSNGVKATDYRLLVRMRFGLTELTVTAEDMQTGSNMQASMTFEHSNLAI